MKKDLLQKLFKLRRGQFPVLPKDDTFFITKSDVTFSPSYLPLQFIGDTGWTGREMGVFKTAEAMQSLKEGTSLLPAPEEPWMHTSMVWSDKGELPLDVVRSLLPFVSTDETRRNLCGVYCRPEHGRYVSTDGHRLATIAVTPDEDPRHFSGILPSTIKRPIDFFGKSVNRGAKEARFSEVWFVQGDEDVLFRGHAFRVAAPGGTLVYGAYPIDDCFPDYDRVIPRPFGRERRTLLSRIEEAVRGVDVDAAHHFCMDFPGWSDHARVYPTAAMRLQRASLGLDDGVHELPLGPNGTAETWGDGVMGVNRKYLQDALNFLRGGSPEVDIFVEDEYSPILMQDPLGRRTVVTMPVRALKEDGLSYHEQGGTK